MITLTRHAAHQAHVLNCEACKAALAEYFYDMFFGHDEGRELAEEEEYNNEEASDYFLDIDDELREHQYIEEENPRYYLLELMEDEPKRRE